MCFWSTLKLIHFDWIGWLLFFFVYFFFVQNPLDSFHCVYFFFTLPLIIIIIIMITFPVINEYLLYYIKKKEEENRLCFFFYSNTNLTCCLPIRVNECVNMLQQSRLASCKKTTTKSNRQKKKKKRRTNVDHFCFARLSIRLKIEILVKTVCECVEKFLISTFDVFIEYICLFSSSIFFHLVFIFIDSLLVLVIWFQHSIILILFLFYCWFWFYFPATMRGIFDTIKTHSSYRLFVRFFFVCVCVWDKSFGPNQIPQTGQQRNFIGMYKNKRPIDYDGFIFCCLFKLSMWYLRSS